MCSFTHRSAFAALLPFLFLVFSLFTIVQALTRGGGHALKILIAVKTAVTTRPTVVNRLIKDGEGRRKSFKTIR